MNTLGRPFLQFKAINKQRHLSAEIIDEYNHRLEVNQPTQDLIDMAMELVPFFVQHNAEADACDLLIELEIIDRAVEFVDKENFTRVCLYIVSCVPYAAPPDDIAILKAAHTIYRKVEQLPQALQIAIKLGDLNLIKEDMDSCADP
jgi:26S proteasome regulatory subunit N1